MDSKHRNSAPGKEFQHLGIILSKALFLSAIIFLVAGASSGCVKNSSYPETGGGAGGAGKLHWDHEGLFWKEGGTREEFGSSGKLNCEAGKQGCICERPNYRCEEGAECFWGHCYGKDFPAPDTYRYTKKARGDYHVLKKLIIDELKLKPGMKIADLGAGEGNYTFEIATKLGKDGVIYSTDTDKGAVNRIRERIKDAKDKGHARIEAELVDDRRETGLEDLPDDHLDLILMINSVTFERPGEKDQDVEYMRMLYQKLKPGGSAVYHSDWFEEGPGLKGERGGWAGSGSGLSRADLQGYFAAAGFHPEPREVAMPAHIPATTYFVMHGRNGGMEKRNLYRGYIFFFNKPAQ